MSRRPIPASTMTKACGSDNVSVRTPSNESTNHDMILPLHEQVRARVREALARLHGITDHDLTVPIEYPPNRTLGDLGTPVAFDLARRLRKAPRAIAQELAGAPGPIPGIARVEAAPNGYLNVFLDRSAFLLSRLGLAGELPAPPAHTQK